MREVGGAPHEDRVVPIRQFLKEAAFSPEVISIMSAVFDEVCKVAKASGRPDLTKETIATVIIERARSEETDRVALREKVLRELGLSEAPKEP
jgi:hypothetical protein